MMCQPSKIDNDDMLYRGIHDTFIKGDGSIFSGAFHSRNDVNLSVDLERLTCHKDFF